MIQDLERSLHEVDQCVLEGRFEEAERRLTSMLDSALSAAEREQVISYRVQVGFEALGGEPMKASLPLSRKINAEGESLISKSLCDEAIRIFESWLLLNPRDFRALNNLGVALYHSGRNHAALDFFLSALSVNPAYGDALANALWSALSEGCVDKVIPALKEAKARGFLKGLIKTGERKIESSPTYPYWKRFEAASREENEAEMARQILHVLVVSPFDPEAFEALAFIAHGRKKYLHSTLLYEVASLLSPGTAYDALEMSKGPN